LTGQAKRNFELPIKRWMRGPLRDFTRHGLESLKGSGCVTPGGVDDVWRAFEREPESPMWSRAWLLAVAGAYLHKFELLA
jgi:asparagine synthase (glutamine-hydrolysing)